MTIFGRKIKLARCAVVIAKFNELCHELLSHSSYCPDLALSAYILFLNLKKWLGKKCFGTKHEIFAGTNAILRTSTSLSIYNGSNVEILMLNQSQILAEHQICILNAGNIFFSITLYY